MASTNVTHIIDQLEIPMTSELMGCVLIEVAASLLKEGASIDCTLGDLILQCHLKQGVVFDD